ncbi:MAG: autotransporter-associated beta strand repeat-containing protein [Tepidisphaeraceae bacterium]
MQIGNGGTIGTLSTAAVTNNATLRFNRSNTLTQGTDFGTIGGSGDLTQSGAGTTVLNAANTYTGTTNVNAGTLTAAGGAAVPDAGVVIVNTNGTFNVTGNETVGSVAGSGDLTLANGVTLTHGGNNASTTFSGDITGGGALTKQGAGTTTLGGLNTYTGATNVYNGAIRVASIASNTGTNNTISLGSGAGVGTLVYTGTGEVSPKSIYQSAGAAANGGTLDMSGTGALRFTGATLAANASQQHTLTLQGSTTGIGQIDGVISDGSATNKTSLLKQGTGTWVLAGANTYTGITTVIAGTLRATPAAYNNLLTNAGGIVLGNTGGVLELDYTTTSPASLIDSILTAGYPSFTAGRIRAAAALAAGQAIGYADDASEVTVRVTLGGDADLDGDVDFNDFLALQAHFGTAGNFGNGDFNYDHIVDFNDFLLMQTNFGQALAAGATADVTAEQVAAMTAFGNAIRVPEPTSLALLGSGGLMLTRRRRC